MSQPFELLERRLLLARPDPSPADNVYFRLPLAVDTSVHFYYDRNEAAAGAVAWNGTSQSYNNHRGTDYSGGPRGRPVFAAAPGILIGKDDGWGDGQGPGNGNFARINHGNNRAGLPINTVYLHFEAGTTTTKPLGSFIATGEQIGGVGTSGNSTGLHLHLETQVNRVAFDPYKAIGSNEVSWWVNQGSGSPSTAAQPNKLSVGDTAQVYELSQGGSGSLNVRGPNPTSGVIGTRTDGALGTVIEGPVWSAFNNDTNNSLWVWYKVRWADGLEGWSAHNWLRRAVDVTPPLVTGASFEFEVNPHRVMVGFNEHVGASLSGSDFLIEDVATLQTFGTTVTFDPATNTAAVSLGGTLGDGNYRATINPAGITDSSGNALAAGTELDFFVLAADATRDRVVNLDDFTALASHFGQTGRVFSQGDFNYNGSVTLADFTILASRFGQSLAEPGARPGPARPAVSTNIAAALRSPMQGVNDTISLNAGASAVVPTERMDDDRKWWERS
ncbi:MAG TPA: peptidoglycan DD-metalloendopeptidase family protein [Tepidisphaeraceae bacterium]|nr:peptidoglycan DD-metalloendopeptidase family protein [Tepidisphaeraceae bacterium]